MVDKYKEIVRLLREAQTEYWAARRECDVLYGARDQAVLEYALKNGIAPKKRLNHEDTASLEDMFRAGDGSGTDVKLADFYRDNAVYEILKKVKEAESRVNETDFTILQLSRLFYLKNTTECNIFKRVLDIDTDLDESKDVTQTAEPKKGTA